MLRLLLFDTAVLRVAVSYQSGDERSANKATDLHQGCGGAPEVFRFCHAAKAI